MEVNFIEVKDRLLNPNHIVEVWKIAGTFWRIQLDTGRIIDVEGEEADRVRDALSTPPKPKRTRNTKEKTTT